jgi:hypothetical protein
MQIGIPIPGQAVAMAKAINIPAIFHERFQGVEEVFVDFVGGYKVYITAVKEGVHAAGERVKLERKNKQRNGKGKSSLQLRIPFPEIFWRRLHFYENQAGQMIKLTFEDEGDFLAVTFDSLGN